MITISEQLNMITSTEVEDRSHLLLNIFNQNKDETFLWINRGYTKIKDLTDEDLVSSLKYYTIQWERFLSIPTVSLAQENETRVLIAIVEKSISNRRTLKLLKIKNRINDNNK